MAEEIKLAHNRWKKNLELMPTESELTLVSLYDLLYDENGTLWAERASAKNQNATLDVGTKLGHDVICHNTLVYRTDSTGVCSVDTSLEIGNSISDIFGIDISIPQYDTRAKKSVGTLRDASVEVGDDNRIAVGIFRKDTYYMYDKDAALAPRTLNLFNKGSVFHGGAASVTNDTVTFNTMIPPKIKVLDRPFKETSEASMADIYIASADTVFGSTLTTHDNLFAYNKIFLSPNSDYTKILLFKALNINTNTLFKSAPQDLKTDRPNQGGGQVLDLTESSSNTIQKAINDASPDLWFKILKNTFVWVRAPFYGDYIRKDSFEQDLTPESQVKHKELMISGAGDFKRYDAWFLEQLQIVSDNEEGRSEYTLPYLPRTTPTVDFYTSDFLKNNLNEIVKDVGDNNYYTNFNEFYLDTNKNTAKDQIEQWIGKNVNGSESPIGSLPSTVINRALAELTPNDADTSEEGQQKKREFKEKYNEINAPGYFDAESHRDDDDYRQIGKFPTIIPKDGNAYIDGRIISPTIDEIWYMLKKLVGGRESDILISDTGTSGNNVRARSLDIAVPYGTGDRANNTNTTMTEVPQSEYNFKSKRDDENFRHGDPIDWKFVKGDTTGKTDASGFNDMSVEITKFISQNNSIVYPIYGSLKSLSEQLTKFNKSRAIENFTAWNDFARPEDENNVIKDMTTVVSGESEAWAPRDVPYSIRELEALSMGNKYNLLSLARFLKENFTFSGGLGKSTFEKYQNVEFDYDEELKELSDSIFADRKQKETDRNYDKEVSRSNMSAGSLYQMHKDYNFQPDSPNTWYNRYGKDNGDEETGAKAIYRDYDNRNLDETKTEKFHKVEVHKYTISNDGRSYEKAISTGRFSNEVFTTRLREDYGTDPSISENQDVISSENVYMAADGTWRHIADHTRLPILRCRF